MRNLETTQRIYAAFARGDVPAILAEMADDVAWEEWADNQGQRGGVPWLARRTGRAGVADFFQELAAWTIHEFTVLDMMAGPRQVAVEFVLDATPHGGARYRDEEIHLWTFNDAGQVTRLRHYTDTAKHLRAAGRSA